MNTAWYVLCAALLLGANGCIFFSSSAAKIGKHYEIPDNNKKAALQEAYTNDDESRLVLRYRARYLKTTVDRWIDLTVPTINPGTDPTVPADTRKATLSVAPPSDLTTLIKLPTQVVHATAEVKSAGTVFEVVGDFSTGYIWKRSSEKLPTIQMNLPEKRHDSASSIVGYAIMPGAIAADVATAPLQGALILRFLLMFRM